MRLKPLGDRLIVRAIEQEEMTASGIVLPDSTREKPQKGKVLAVGGGRLDETGKLVPLDVAEGDEVLYSKYGGTEIKVEGEKLLVLSERDVLAAVGSAEKVEARGDSNASERVTALRDRVVADIDRLRSLST